MEDFMNVKDDLISRSNLLMHLNDYALEEVPFLNGGSTAAYEAVRNCMKAVEKQPTVEAVPVVKCKDCKHWHKDIGWCDKHSYFWDGDYNFCHPWESSNWKMFMENDFCSDGERKE